MHTGRGGSSAFLNVRTVQRQVAALLPTARLSGVGEGVLELFTRGNDAPRLISATVLEEGALRARRVLDPPIEGFRAFLDGTQRSETAVYVDGAPIVVGRAAAVIRERRNRRMHTWHAPLVDTRVYGPRALVSSVTWSTLASAYGALLIDTTEGDAEPPAHPFALRDAAIHRVQAHREALEQRLAERWCTHERDPLFIDGSITGSEAVAVSGSAVGVVKSHRTLYAAGDALAVVLGLAHGERSSVFRITSPKRTTVASWYLRLRDPRGHDPMWGLVRVEAAHPTASAMPGLTARADQVSRWILGEASPLALPDARWGAMVYGVRDCEEYLRAVQ